MDHNNKVVGLLTLLGQALEQRELVLTILVLAVLFLTVLVVKLILLCLLNAASVDDPEYNEAKQSPQLIKANEQYFSKEVYVLLFPIFQYFVVATTSQHLH